MSKATDKKYVSALLEFLDNSPCNFLAVDTVKKILSANGFKEKKIDDKMTAKSGEKFFLKTPSIPLKSPFLSSSMTAAVL